MNYTSYIWSFYNSTDAMINYVKRKYTEEHKEDLIKISDYFSDSSNLQLSDSPYYDVFMGPVDNLTNLKDYPVVVMNGLKYKTEKGVVILYKGELYINNGYCWSKKGY
jgi:hypothetical protein